MTIASRTQSLGRAGRLLLGLAACLIAAGCRPPVAPAADTTPDVALAWTVTPDPPAAGPATLALTLTDTRARRPVAGAAVKLEGDMSHPGMQPVFSTARETAPGRYEAPIRFTMAGDWILLVDARLRDGRTLHREIRLRAS